MRLALGLLTLAALNVFGCKAVVNRPQLEREVLSAVKAGDARRVSELMEQGGSLDARNDSGRDALMIAALQGNREMVRFLLDRKASVHARDRTGMTSLMWGAFGGNAEVVKALMAAGSDAGARDHSGKSALEWAASNKPEIRRLIQSAR